MSAFSRIVENVKRAALYYTVYALDACIGCGLHIQDTRWFQHITYYYRRVHSYASGIRLEPDMDGGWMSVTYVSSDCQLKETYSEIDHDILYLGNVSRRDLVIAKRGERRGCWVEQKDDYMIPVRRFTAPFMSVRYTNRGQGVDVFLDIPKEYYYEGNELFSATFLQRWFEYNMGLRNQVFDLSYSLELFDDDMRSVYIFCNQFVRLLPGGAYEIIQ